MIRPRKKRNISVLNVYLINYSYAIDVTDRFYDAISSYVERIDSPSSEKEWLNGKPISIYTNERVYRFLPA